MNDGKSKQIRTLIACPHCGRGVIPGTSPCPSCGGPAEVERRKQGIQRAWKRAAAEGLVAPTDAMYTEELGDNAGETVVHTRPPAKRRTTKKVRHSCH